MGESTMGKEMYKDKEENCIYTYIDREKKFNMNRQVIQW